MKKIIFVFTLVFLLCMGCACAEMLELPSNLKIIKAEAFEGDTSIEKVIVPDGTTTIESRAFADSGLKFIQLPNSLTSIADDAFECCENLTVGANEGSYAYNWASGKGYETYVPLKIESITEYTIAETDELLTYEVDVKGGQGNLYYEYKLYKVDYKSGDLDLVYTEKCLNCNQFSFVPGITLDDYMIWVDVKDEVGSESSIYRACPILKKATPAPASDFIYEDWYGDIYIDEYIGTDSSITLPSKINGKRVIDIGFKSHDRVKTIVLPSSMVQLGNITFWLDNSNLEGVYIPNSITTIGSMVFCDTMLRNIMIPKGVKVLDGTFYGCSYLRSVTIPSSVTKILDETFLDCYSLKSVYIPASVKTISPGAFEGCNNLTCIVEEGSYAQQFCINNNIKYVFPF